MENVTRVYSIQNIQNENGQKGESGTGKTGICGNGTHIKEKDENFLDTAYYYFWGCAVSLMFVPIPFLILVLVLRPVKHANTKRALKHGYGLALWIQFALLYLTCVMIYLFDFEKSLKFWGLKHFICLIYVVYVLLYTTFDKISSKCLNCKKNLNERKPNQENVHVAEIP